MQIVSKLFLNIRFKKFNFQIWLFTQICRAEYLLMQYDFSHSYSFINFSKLMEAIKLELQNIRLETCQLYKLY